MKWSIHPAKKNKKKAIIVGIFVIAFLVYMGVFFGIFWSIFGFAVLFLSAYSFYFPTHYSISGDEITIKSVFSTQKRSLQEFKKMYPGKNGVLLSPFRHKTFLNRFRGVFLFLPAEREPIIDLLRGKIEEPAEEPLTNSHAPKSK